jgi:hypothetical protein
MARADLVCISSCTLYQDALYPLPIPTLVKYLRDRDRIQRPLTVAPSQTLVIVKSHNLPHFVHASLAKEINAVGHHQKRHP